MTTQAARLARVHRLLAAFNSHDVRAVAEHLAVQVERNHGDGGRVQGRDTLARHLEILLSAFSDAALTSVRVLAFPPDSVVVEWVLEAAQTGRAVRVAGADLISFNSADEIELDEARIDTIALQPQPGIWHDRWPEPDRIRDLLQRYTAAWCGRNPAAVAAFYSPGGSLSVNGGAPAVGRNAIAEVAQGFMTAFPDLEVSMDGILIRAGRAIYRWTLTGTHTAPGGAGSRVRISGFEVQQIDAGGLISESRGYFDSSAYQQQLENGVRESPLP